MAIRPVLLLACALTLASGARPHGVSQSTQAAVHRFLYVAEPGIRNYLEYGGIGVLVFDIDDGTGSCRRIPTVRLTAGQEPDNVKGIVASAATGRLYVSTIKRVLAFDLVTESCSGTAPTTGAATGWPSRPTASALRAVVRRTALERLDAGDGDAIARSSTNSGAHNTVYRPRRQAASTSPA